MVVCGEQGSCLQLRERVRRSARRVRAARDQRHGSRAGPERRLSRRVESGGVPCPGRRVQAARRGRGATPPAVGLLPLAPWTEHAFVGAGDRPCVILMVGARLSPEVRYPVSELATRYGASVEKETSDPEQAYATAERFRRERPPCWSRLPWG